MTPFRGFSRPPRVRQWGEGVVETQDSLEYVDDRRRYRVIVPAGFVSDGPSVPKWGWPLLEVGFLYLLSHGLLHDYLYRKDASIVAAGHYRPVPSRSFADRAMYEGMRTKPSTAGNALRVRFALWVGGWTSWQVKSVDWRP